MDTIEETPTPPKLPKKGDVGPILGIIIIIILLALGGLYYFTTGVEQIQDVAPSTVGSVVAPEYEAAAITTQGSSNALTDIEADVNATDLSGLDNATANVDAGLQEQ